MKLNENFILRTIAGEDMLIPLGETSAELSGIITLNPVGATIWKALAETCTVPYAIEKVLEIYDVDEATAQADVAAFWEKLTTLGLIVNE